MKKLIIFILILLMALLVGLMTIYTIAQPSESKIVGLVMLTSLLASISTTLVIDPLKLLN